MITEKRLLFAKKPGSIYNENQKLKTHVHPPPPLIHTIVTSDSRLKLNNPAKNEIRESDFVS